MVMLEDIFICAQIGPTSKTGYQHTFRAIVEPSSLRPAICTLSESVKHPPLPAALLFLLPASSLHKIKAQSAPVGRASPRWRAG
eukprot:6207328-Pleurochrysis_carterae.AAC.3